VFVLGIGEGEDAFRISDLLLHTLRKTADVAFSGKDPSLLFLLPDPETHSQLDFLDPFPGAAEICRFPERWPGILFWNRFGNTLFRPLDPAQRVLENRRMLRRIAQPLSYEDTRRIASGYLPPTSSSRQVRILHLSDLHFGTKYAANNQDYLLAVIKSDFK